MSPETEIGELYREFERALKDVLFDRRDLQCHERLQRARLALASHPLVDPYKYREMVERALQYRHRR